MPLAVIDGILRDEAGLPTAQLVAAVAQAQEGVRLGRTGAGWGAGDGVSRGCWELWLLVGGAMGLTRQEATKGVKGAREGRGPT